MRTIAEVLVGALVFITIDRLARVVSSSIVDGSSRDKYNVEKSMLRIEVLSLIVTLFIAIHFVKF